MAQCDKETRTHQADPFLLHEDVVNGDECRMPEEILRRCFYEGGSHAVLVGGSPSGAWGRNRNESVVNTKV